MSLYKDASLVMIPSAYKDGKLYSIRPTDGDGDFTFSRGSNLAATRVDVNGLIEKGRENLLLQSNQFDTTWVNFNTSDTGGQSGYDGSSDAWLLSNTGASGYIRQTSISASGIQTFSIYAKAGSLNWLRVTSQSGNVKFNVNLSNGTIGTTGNLVIEAKATDIGSGWYRCSMAFNASTTGIYIYPATADDDTSQTSGNIYIQDAQLEKGLVATDYIETGASTAQAGILEDMPRLDYSGGASCPALLLEPQRTNSLIHSEYFGGLTIQELTAEYNSIVSPSGIQDAVKFTDNSNSARHRILKEAFASNQNDPSTCSVFAKKGTARYAFLTASNGNQVCTIIADLEDGVITHEESATSATHKDIEDFGNGWYRITLAIAGGNSTTSRYWQCGISPSAVPTNYIGNIPTYSGSGDYLYFYGGQQELNASYPTSYIPTYGTSVTRSGDRPQILNTTTDILSQTAFTLFFEVDLTSDTTNNFRDIVAFRGSSKTLRFETRTDDSVRVQHSSMYTSGDNWNSAIIGDVDNKKFAMTFTTSQVRLYADGSLVNTYDGVYTSDLNNVLFVNSLSTGVETKTNFKQYILFTTALTDSECIALTTL